MQVILFISDERLKVVAVTGDLSRRMEVVGIPPDKISRRIEVVGVPPDKISSRMEVVGVPPDKSRWRVAGEGGPLGVGRCSYSLYKDFLSNPQVQSLNFKSFVDGSVSSLLEHCLGWGREEKEEVRSSPLLDYLQHSPRPCPRHVEALCTDPLPLTSSGRGPLHVLLTSPNLLPDHHHLEEVVSVLLSSTTSPTVSLVSLSRLVERRAWSQAASVAQLLLSRTDCDVNSGSAHTPALVHFIAFQNILASIR